MLNPFVSCCYNHLTESVQRNFELKLEKGRGQFWNQLKNQINIRPWTLLTEERVKGVARTEKNSVSVTAFAWGLVRNWLELLKNTLGDATVYQSCFWPFCYATVVLLLGRSQPSFKGWQTSVYLGQARLG